MTSRTLFRYSPLMVITSPERASAGEKESMEIGSVYSRSKRVLSTVPSLATTVTGPTSGPSSGTVTRISLRGPVAIFSMEVTVTLPAKWTSVTRSRLLPTRRRTPPRITGLGSTAARVTFLSENWAVSSCSRWQEAKSVVRMQRAASTKDFIVFFIFCPPVAYL